MFTLPKILHTCIKENALGFWLKGMTKDVNSNDNKVSDNLHHLAVVFFRLMKYGLVRIHYSIVTQCTKTRPTFKRGESPLGRVHEQRRWTTDLPAPVFRPALAGISSVECIFLVGGSDA